MANQTITGPIISLSEVIKSREPKSLTEQRLISLLTKRFGDLQIIWNPKAFREGLNNPELPSNILKKLDSLLLLAETIDWKISKPLKDELDSTVEDIETFNPSFRMRLKKASEEFRAGKFIALEALEKKFGLTKKH
ncbi:hypothetical protein A2926_00385 [Candidatus Giovannonibacteria bacterium RIFCSPLOWO2_01_FULL_44_40]|uniref:Uncharacterized protein n=1 Tax=Candidatus Giovannonibacteria bacterium RIFCSPHIGHO2_01_FULL_45_23 TaxID=1798325 RepID=A0A1F5VEP6_9BACT|nr:MAG: hypothetical protein A2834_00400 [Candidatus Giovannonibacteria bacterium RIFCSPHIGHO2_01_FULL_45_23]OGF76508.1 MAG: hypothetical protein A3C77_03105 [Candidatus Giovannonibacteria bacterium RIFCSPHIGHO2_02_FULL_45_13]OGF79774.1 MAG: hypothetical protein A2926_00385 [Candidatus Giovannonibacteria bacterium RIFCSPLOWO2_01_FULL_44_40]